MENERKEEQNDSAAPQTVEEPQINTKKTFKQKFIAYLKAAPKRYFITAFSGMTVGLFCTLIAGTIVQTIASIFQGWADPVYTFLYNIGLLAKIMMGAGIGAGIANSLKAPKLVIAGAIAAGFIGAYAKELSYADGFIGIFIPNSAAEVLGLSGRVTSGFVGEMGKGSPGNPVNSWLCAVVAVELGMLVSGKTKLDILVVPLTCLLSAGLVAITLGQPIDWLITQIGKGINAAAGADASAAQRFFMSIIIAVVMGLLLTLPTSSAAIGISIQLSGLAAGAAVAGCCAHMIGFAVASFRENKWSGLISQGLGTSMLQIPNVFKKPRILLPAVAASIVCAPVATMIFGLQSDAVGSGMGTAGLVGVIQTFKVSLGEGVGMPVWRIILGVAVSLFILPAAIAFLVSEIMRKKNWIKFGDMKLPD